MFKFIMMPACLWAFERKLSQGFKMKRNAPLQNWAVENNKINPPKIRSQIENLEEADIVVTVRGSFSFVDTCFIDNVTRVTLQWLWSAGSLCDWSDAVIDSGGLSDVWWAEFKHVKAEVTRAVSVSSQGGRAVPRPGSTTSAFVWKTTKKRLFKAFLRQELEARLLELAHIYWKADYHNRITNHNLTWKRLASRAAVMQFIKYAAGF